MASSKASRSSVLSWPDPLTEAKARARAARPELASRNLAAVEAATAKYQAELDAKG